jgi:hypothetical protein
MYEIVNKGLNNLNGVYGGVARHIWCQKDQWRNTSQYYIVIHNRVQIMMTFKHYA